MTIARRPLLITAALAGAHLLGAPVHAQGTYPDKPIRMIVPFPASGTADIVARLIGAKITEQTGQQVVIENRVGANGNIGTDAVAKSAADGYTVLLGSTPNMVINPALYPKIPFDTRKDFTPVIALGAAPNVLVVHPSVPATNLKDFLAYAKGQPQPLAFASGGNGSTGHLALEMLSEASKVKFSHVAYRGGPQAITDLIGGQVQALFFPAAAVLQHVRSGKLKAIAVASPKRSSVMPDVPTVAEAGYANFDASPWFGFFVPAGTPRAVVEKLQATSIKGLAAEDVRKAFSDQGIEPMGETTEAYTRRVSHDLQRWAEVVQRSGATIE